MPGAEPQQHASLATNPDGTVPIAPKPDSNAPGLPKPGTTASVSLNPHGVALPSKQEATPGSSDENTHGSSSQAIGAPSAGSPITQQQATGRAGETGFTANEPMGPRRPGPEYYYDGATLQADSGNGTLDQKYRTVTETVETAILEMLISKPATFDELARNVDDLGIAFNVSQEVSLTLNDLADNHFIILKKIRGEKKWQITDAGQKYYSELPHP